MDNNKVKPLGKKEFENDKKLEQKLIDVVSSDIIL